MPVFFEGKHYDAYSFAKKLVRKADYDTTVKLNEGASLVGLELIDHLIIGSADSENGLGFVSMAELMTE